MVARSKTDIALFFETGDRPTESQFQDLIDSYVDKLGPLGTIETAASAGSAGFVRVSGGNGEVLSDSATLTELGITVSTTAQADAVITSRIATTAQAASADNSTTLMTPQLVSQVAGSGGGLVLLAVATANNSATVDFTSNIDSTYEEYIISGTSIIPATDGQALHLRTSSDGGSNFDAGASDYEWNGLQITTTGVTQSNSTGDTEIDFTVGNGFGFGNQTGEGMNVIVRLMDPSDTALNTAVRFDAFGSTSTNGDPRFGIGSGFRATAQAVNAVRFLFGAGNISSGEFRLYGVARS